MSISIASKAAGLTLNVSSQPPTATTSASAPAPATNGPIGGGDCQQVGSACQALAQAAKAVEQAYPWDSCGMEPAQQPHENADYLTVAQSSFSGPSYRSPVLHAPWQ